MVGFIGLGIMGKPMAKNLRKAGVELMVYDLKQEAVDELVALGAHPGSLEAMGERCEAVFIILPTGAIVQSVLFGENGLAPRLRKGAIVCDCSSVTPGESRFCARELASYGVGFVDCPVSGGEPGAINGTLAFMAGGSRESFDALKPYFDAMGSSATLMGDNGAGSVTKLANQIIVNNTIAAVSEAMVLATKAGVDPEKVYQAIRGGLAGSTVLDTKAPKMFNRDFAPGGTITVNHKDIKNVLAAAHELDVPVPYSAQLFEIMQTLKAHGHMQDDHAGIVQYFEMLAGVQVKKAE